jgi:hypothetical protein
LGRRGRAPRDAVRGRPTRTFFRHPEVCALARLEG